MKPDSALTQARIQLMLEHPFLASAIAAFPLVEVSEEWCRTMATDGVAIFANRQWSGSLPPGDLQFVIAHEVMHCVLGHIDRRGDRVRDLWNVATDLATNLFLSDVGLECPPQALLRREVRGLSAEEIYEGLMSNRLDAARLITAALDKAETQSVRSGREIVGRFDTHLDPGDLRAAQVRPEDLASPEERRRLRSAVWRGMSGKLPGTLRGVWHSDIETATTPRVDWRVLLARFVTGLRRGDFRLYPFNRKHLWRGLYLPSVGTPGPEWLVVAVDTSASVSDTDLGAMFAELDSLRAASECRLTLIQCDCEIQQITEFEAYEPVIWDRAKGKAGHTFHGRGGTDFRPVFTWVEEQCRHGRLPDALIYMTDGFGPFPQAQPAFEVVWVLIPNSVRAVPFGGVIRM